MNEEPQELSERVVTTVAEALGKNPIELPPLEHTISADALDYLFHRKPHPEGAYTVFPYCDLWVVVHCGGAIDVFETYRATTASEQFPDGTSKPSPDERIAVLYVGTERFTLYREQLDAVHRIVSEATTGEEAWDETVEYARREDG